MVFYSLSLSYSMFSMSPKTEIVLVCSMYAEPSTIISVLTVFQYNKLNKPFFFFFSYSISHLFSDNKLRWRKRFTFSSHLQSSCHMSTHTHTRKTAQQNDMKKLWKFQRILILYLIWGCVTCKRSTPTNFNSVRCACKKYENAKKKAKRWKKKMLKKKNRSIGYIYIGCVYVLDTSVEHTQTPHLNTKGINLKETHRQHLSRRKEENNI